MQWEVVIGLETHAQLSTESKIFSGASTHFGAGPNTQASALDLALPGTLPVMNRGAVEKAIRFGLAVGADIAPVSIFARKNYFYPDLPKGYQISQLEKPVLAGGKVSFMLEQNGKQEIKTIPLTRAHLEEDAGKSLHEDYLDMSGIDLNRAGTPLLEIVTEPDMRSAAEAVAYAKTLHSLVTWLGVCDGNMQEGSFRCDANVSVRPKGQAEFGTRCEIKNLNSFRNLEDAINYEVQRQIELIESGGSVVQATRLYDPDRRETREMRTKEDSQDYRYFPDPDLPPLVISPEWIEKVKAQMPELPDAMRERFITDYGLSEYDATVLTQSKAMADYYEKLVARSGMPLAKQSANWLMGDVSSALNRENIGIDEAPVTAGQLSLLMTRISDGTISNKIAKEIFADMWESGSGEADSVDKIIEAKGLKQISDAGELEKIIDEVLAANQKSVEEFRAGRDKAFNSLVGQVMKATKGKGNPAQVNELLRKKLAG
ncbi:Asp-tRNA(Asn)/Glu-tRNA(Gln) amidotransferase subunit GatB [Oxalobacter vibrioformis]|uniref:Aspartyl/glutamyl-tRNA(Asn/Gln) amidotransferase subunit B n=1 Tax=Oxalobacter vibrioformis TaxID=933080 RepID=A0A9E9M1E8_9BURK|nr:Asp-tRNA(Asn)/Glu-tRNA(Gln) amidotransferase subunit GatB [Oxalobacter vibrioformis]WAW10748.1 Asp-tRNA(Asn)/Glu-tRNA(Gln) amidotransferase subunit GatB [Oxalobacter vibrioformis]